MRIAILAMALLAAPTVALATPQQFDLVCTGAFTNGPSKGADWNYRLSVDLAAGAWCEIACDTPQPIVRVFPGAIAFSEGALGLTVNRVTGEIAHVSRLDGSIAQGVCKVTTFTPFPANKF